MFMEILFDDKIRAAAPGLTVVAIEADVTNGPTSDELWQLLERAASDIAAVTEVADINRRPAIRATRDAYKALGKDPNRYRPSAEALTRRAVRGLGLYRINTLVDLINLLSLQSGYSIGGFDASLIEGATLTLGVGEEGEPFEGIGRGPLNIHGLPVYRDAIGGIGTPTSDNERTKLSESTTRVLICINIYGEEMPPQEVAAYAVALLERWAEAQNVTVRFFHP